MQWKNEKNMNMCLHGTIATGVETLRARVQYNMERGRPWYGLLSFK